jgi:superfamily I DNA and/or RNA helicase
MIMSPVVANKMPPGLARFAGTPNLVNVAITRARSRLIIVGDRDACLDSETVPAEYI